MTVGLRILRILRHGEMISGQRIADQLGVSRAAVNQQIARLQQSGIEFHRVRGRGYRLVTPVAPLCVDEIVARVQRRDARPCPRIELFDEVDSTNDVVKGWLAENSTLACVCFAEHQRRGRGRRGRSWLSKPFHGIQMSYGFRLEPGQRAVAGLSLGVGVAICRALENMGVTDARLKWPNDVMLGSAKAGGVLIEISGEVDQPLSCVIGIGLNVRADPDRDEAISQAVASIEDAAGEPVDRNRLCAELIVNLVDLLRVFVSSGFHVLADEWQARHANQGQRISIIRGSERIEGIATGVDSNGSLLLIDGYGAELRVSTGEVQA